MPNFKSNLPLPTLAFRLNLKNRNRHSNGKAICRGVELAIAQKDIERSEESAYRFRLERLLPFFDALNRSVVHSYSVIGLQILEGVRGYFPALVDKSLEGAGHWLKAVQEVSDLRIQVLLWVHPDLILPLVQEMHALMRLHQDILEARGRYLSGRADLDEVVHIQSQYVRRGYRLMMDVRSAAIRSEYDGRQRTREELDGLAELAVGPLEGSSAVSVPYGKVHRVAWTAIWSVDIRMLKFENVEGGIETVWVSVTDLGLAAQRMPSCVEAKWLRCSLHSDPDEFQKIVLSISFSSSKALDDYLNIELPAIRQERKVLWQGL
jgi:hypothetical protein